MAESGTSDALPAGYSLHWYEIERVQGTGGFGVTYLAHDTNLGQRVAIKEYLPGDIATRDTDHRVCPRAPEHSEPYAYGLSRFIEEARVLAQFRHSNIVTVHTVFEMNDTAYMVMQFEHGHSLAGAFRQNLLRTESDYLDILHPLLDGLEQVHAAGFIHRDIKPANILLREDGEPVLIDFGAARRSALDGGELTSVLTPGYAPFEQWGMTRDAAQGPWTDIYSLAATIYRGVAGKRPESALDRAGAALNGQTDPLQPASALAAGRFSTAFLEAIDAAMALRVEDRPQSVAAFRAFLPPPSRAGSTHQSSAASDESQPHVKDAPTRQPEEDDDAPTVILAENVERARNHTARTTDASAGNNASTSPEGRAGKRGPRLAVAIGAAAVALVIAAAWQLRSGFLPGLNEDTAAGTAATVVAEPTVTTPAATVQEPAQTVVEAPAETAPVAKAPTVKTPAVAAQMAADPVAEVPAETAPVATEPTVETPAVTAQVAADRVAEAPAETAPVATEPTVKTPAVAAQVAADPAAEAPAEAAPVATEPALQSPAVAAQVAADPAVEAPAETAPVATEPAVQSPPVVAPETTEPAIAIAQAAPTTGAETPVVANPVAAAPLVAAADVAAATLPDLPTPESDETVANAAANAAQAIGAASSPIDAPGLPTRGPTQALPVAAVEAIAAPEAERSTIPASDSAAASPAIAPPAPTENLSPPAPATPDPAAVERTAGVDARTDLPPDVGQGTSRLAPPVAEAQRASASTVAPAAAAPDSAVPESTDTGPGPTEAPVDLSARSAEARSGDAPGQSAPIEPSPDAPPTDEQTAATPNIAESGRPESPGEGEAFAATSADADLSAAGDTLDAAKREAGEHAFRPAPERPERAGDTARPPSTLAAATVDEGALPSIAEPSVSPVIVITTDEPLAVAASEAVVAVTPEAAAVQVTGPEPAEAAVLSGAPMDQRLPGDARDAPVVVTPKAGGGAGAVERSDESTSPSAADAAGPPLPSTTVQAPTVAATDPPVITAPAAVAPGVIASVIANPEATTAPAAQADSAAVSGSAIPVTEAERPKAPATRPMPDAAVPPTSPPVQPAAIAAPRVSVSIAPLGGTPEAGGPEVTNPEPAPIATEPTSAETETVTAAAQDVPSTDVAAAPLTTGTAVPPTDPVPQPATTTAHEVSVTTGPADPPEVAAPEIASPESIALADDTTTATAAESPPGPSTPPVPDTPVPPPEVSVTTAPAVTPEVAALEIARPESIALADDMTTATAAESPPGPPTPPVPDAPVPPPEVSVTTAPAVTPEVAAPEIASPESIALADDTTTATAAESPPVPSTPPVPDAPVPPPQVSVANASAVTPEVAAPEIASPEPIALADDTPPATTAESPAVPAALPEPDAAVPPTGPSGPPVAIAASEVSSATAPVVVTREAVGLEVANPQPAPIATDPVGAETEAEPVSAPAPDLRPTEVAAAPSAPDAAVPPTGPPVQPAGAAMPDSVVGEPEPAPVTQAPRSSETVAATKGAEEETESGPERDAKPAPPPRPRARPDQPSRPSALALGDSGLQPRPGAEATLPATPPDALVIDDSNVDKAKADEATIDVADADEAGAGGATSAETALRETAPDTTGPTRTGLGESAPVTTSPAPAPESVTATGSQPALPTPSVASTAAVAPSEPATGSDTTSATSPSAATPPVDNSAVSAPLPRESDPDSDIGRSKSSEDPPPSTPIDTPAPMPARLVDPGNDRPTATDATTAEVAATETARRETDTEKAVDGNVGALPVVPASPRAQSDEPSLALTDAPARVEQPAPANDPLHVPASPESTPTTAPALPSLTGMTTTSDAARESPAPPARAEALDSPAQTLTPDDLPTITRDDVIAALNLGSVFEDPTPPPLSIEPITTREAVEKVRCAALRVAETAGEVVINGYVAGETPLPPEVRQSTNGRALVMDVKRLPGRLCAVLEAMGKYWSTADTTARLLLEHDSPILLEGEWLTLLIDGPDFDSTVQVAYFSLDGSVVHLVPNLADAPSRLAARQRLRLGEEQDWVVSEPFGKEFLMLVSTPEPLFNTSRPDVESIDDYVDALRSRLGELSGRDAANRISVDFLRIETRQRE